LNYSNNRNYILFSDSNSVEMTDKNAKDVWAINYDNDGKMN